MLPPAVPVDSEDSRAASSASVTASPIPAEIWGIFRRHTTDEEAFSWCLKASVQAKPTTKVATERISNGRVGPTA